MKKIVYIFLIGLLMVSSCTDDVLEKVPLDIISDNTVWNDQVLIDAYLTQVYVQMPILLNETSGLVTTDWASSENWNGPFIVNELADESKRNWIVGQSEKKYGTLKIDGGLLEWWELSYKAIRTLNVFIERVPKAPVDDNFRKSRTAEARFLRAYNYFSMVKRYGGVPLITKSQSINDPQEELYPKRDSEQAVYDFVLSELEDIYNDLPNRASADLGRPTKFAAIALKSRVALYAASIAKFGTVQLNGAIGIESSKAAGYYQQAFDAAEKVMNSGEYSLYNKDIDKVENFKNIFLKKDNSEVIFAVRHNYIDKGQGGNGWVWDFFQCPKPHAWNAGNQNAPYLEMAEEFEHTDGTPGTLDRNAIQQGLWTTTDLWGTKDPRFYATIYTMNTPWQGSIVDFHHGLLLPTGTVQNDGSYNGVSALGLQLNDGSYGTGFGVMKYLEESHSNLGERATSGTDWQLIRYAEVLLNYAEAAVELGKSGEALNAVNQIRNRAGIKNLSIVNRGAVRHERKIELAFEGHRYWDLRRWREAVVELSKNRSGLQYILDYSTRKFKLVVINNVDGTVSPPAFYPQNYYFPITLTRTGNNPNLVENPGY